MFEVSFDNLNEAIKQLPYARVYQSPVESDDVFNIEVKEQNGGSYDAMKQLVELAEQEGFKYDRYYEMADFNGDYHYTAKMKSDKPVRCYFDQSGVYTVD